MKLDNRKKPYHDPKFGIIKPMYLGNGKYEDDEPKYPNWQGPVINNGMLCINKKGDACYRIMDYDRETGNINVFNLLKQRIENIHRNSIGVTFYITDDKSMSALYHKIKNRYTAKLSWITFWHMCAYGKSPS